MAEVLAQKSHPAQKKDDVFSNKVYIDKGYVMGCLPEIMCNIKLVKFK